MQSNTEAIRNIDGWYMENYHPESPLVFVKFEGIKRGEFRKLTPYHIGARIPNPDGKDEKLTHAKHEILFIARDCDWQIVKSCVKWRNEVRAKGLKPESGLARLFDTKRYFKPFLKSGPVRLILRNGLVITGEIHRFDRFQATVKCKAKEDVTACIVVFKHALLSVEPCKSFTS